MMDHNSEDALASPSPPLTALPQASPVVIGGGGSGLGNISKISSSPLKPLPASTPPSLTIATSSTGEGHTPMGSLSSTTSIGSAAQEDTDPSDIQLSHDQNNDSGSPLPSPPPPSSPPRRLSHKWSTNHLPHHHHSMSATTAIASSPNIPSPRSAPPLSSPQPPSSVQRSRSHTPSHTAHASRNGSRRTSQSNHHFQSSLPQFHHHYNHQMSPSPPSSAIPGAGSFSAAPRFTSPTHHPPPHTLDRPHSTSRRPSSAPAPHDNIPSQQHHHHHRHPSRHHNNGSGGSEEQFGGGRDRLQVDTNTSDNDNDIIVDDHHHHQYHPHHRLPPAIAVGGEVELKPDYHTHPTHHVHHMHHDTVLRRRHHHHHSSPSLAPISSPRGEVDEQDTVYDRYPQQQHYYDDHNHDYDDIAQQQHHQHSPLPNQILSENHDNGIIGNDDDGEGGITAEQSQLMMMNDGVTMMDDASSPIPSTDMMNTGHVAAAAGGVLDTNKSDDNIGRWLWRRCSAKRLAIIFMLVFALVGFVPALITTPLVITTPVIPNADWRLHTQADRDAYTAEVNSLGLLMNYHSAPYLLDRDLNDNPTFSRYRLAMYGVSRIWAYLTLLPKLWTPVLWADDQRFTQIMTQQWPFRWLLDPCPHVLPLNATNASLKIRLAHIKCQAGDLIFDAQSMDDAVAFPGHYVYGSVTIFRPSYDGITKYKTVSITMRGYTMLPPKPGVEESDAWKLAKLHVLMNARYYIMFSQHPHIHFPLDAYYSITRQRLANTNQLLNQLMAPHLEFVHNVNVNVLMSIFSVLNAREGAPPEADAHILPRSHIRKLMLEGGEGRYAPFYRPHHSPNEKLAPYRHAIRNFVSSVLTDRIDVSPDTADGAAIQAWARSLHIVLGYDLPSLVSVDDVIEIVTDHIHRVSVMHSSDHEGLYNVDERYVPMSVAVPWRPDVTLTGAFSTPVPLGDAIVNHFHHVMFVKWWPNPFYDNHMMNVHYTFIDTNPELKHLVDEFKRNLVAAERSVGEELPLSSLCRTVEW